MGSHGHAQREKKGEKKSLAQLIDEYIHASCSDV